MNNTNEQGIKKKEFNKFLLFSFLFSILILVIYLMNRSGEPRPKEFVDYKIFFEKTTQDDIKKTLDKIKEYVNQDSQPEPEPTNTNFEIFEISIDTKSQSFNTVNISIKSIIKKDTKDNKIEPDLKIKLLNYITEVSEGKNFFFISEQKSNITLKNNYLKNFFNLKSGTKHDSEIFANKFNDNNLFSRNILRNNNIEPLTISFDKVYEETKNEETSNSLKYKELNVGGDYNKLIKTKLNNENKIQKIFFKTDLKKDNDEYVYIPNFIDDTGDLPIQWPNKINWNFAFYWGYIWNSLIVIIGFFLSFFSFGVGGYFSGIGLGIILTTILIRTLLWPVYIKSNSFSMNMSLMQPEIDKIQLKYALKRDRESMKQMQMEIARVYRKHNFNIFSFFVSFLQIPVFFAMFKALSRFRVPGGIFIFEADSNKHFLGFINLSSSNNGEFLDIFVRMFLASIVGISMFMLNKINAKKIVPKKQNNKVLDEEKVLKQKTQEQTMKIISYIMIMFMVISSFSSSFLALYWIVGNIYTICQTIINQKIMDKKYILLKQKSF
ncbi:YidC/Oxa1 family membrane protein insertase ['Camptotheca acuminata' phytoplasma]|uniref:YidC/Oxa1 family membrane protein insertase n=1 Tax='Camptotheca acuminata' phytoplasma TaxID=3239192 RepID=UPI003519EE51